MARLLAGTGPPLEPGHPGRPEGTLPMASLARRVKKGSCPKALPPLCLEVCIVSLPGSEPEYGPPAEGHPPLMAASPERRTFRRTAVFRACLCRNRPNRRARARRRRCGQHGTTGRGAPRCRRHGRMSGVPVRVPQVFAGAARAGGVTAPPTAGPCAGRAAGAVPCGRRGYRCRDRSGRSGRSRPAGRSRKCRSRRRTGPGLLGTGPQGHIIDGRGRRLFHSRLAAGDPGAAACHVPAAAEPAWTVARALLSCCRRRPTHWATNSRLSSSRAAPAWRRMSPTRECWAAVRASMA